MGRGIIGPTIKKTANKAYNSNPDGCLKAVLLFWLIVIIIGAIFYAVISNEYNKEHADTTDRSSGAASFVMREVKKEITQKYPDAYSIKATKTVQRGTQQYYTVYGEFYHKTGNREIKGSFTASTSYKDGLWSAVQVSVYGGY